MISLMILNTFWIAEEEVRKELSQTRLGNLEKTMKHPGKSEERCTTILFTDSIRSCLHFPLNSCYTVAACLVALEWDGGDWIQLRSTVSVDRCSGNTTLGMFTVSDPLFLPNAWIDIRLLLRKHPSHLEKVATSLSLSLSLSFSMFAHVYICIYTHADLDVRAYLHIYIYIHIYMCIRVYIYIYIYTPIYMCVCAHVCACKRPCSCDLCKFLLMCTCMCV